MVFRREICGKRGGMVYGEGEMKYRVRIEFTVPKLVSLETTLGPITKFLKVFEQKMREKYRKIIFPTFCCLIQKQTRSQFKSTCKKSERNLQ